MTASIRHDRYDAIVIGLGIMGSAIVHRLARSGLRVLGVEQFQVGHALGSSQGHTRLLRRLHFEHPEYTTLAVRAQDLWRDLERVSEQSILLPTGAMIIGQECAPMVRGTLTAADSARMAVDRLTQARLRELLPNLNVQRGDVGVFEAEAGILLTANCLCILQMLAQEAGADLLFNTRCSLPETFDHLHPMKLEIDGRSVAADRVVVAAGPWTRHVLAHRAPELMVERVVSFWLDPLERRDEFQPERFPVTLWDHPDGPLAIFPDVEGAGVKVAFHHSQKEIDPDAIDRSVNEEELAALRKRLEKVAPLLNGHLRHAQVCMYTNTSDGHFAIGALPDDRLLLVSACSGHGFKFAPVIAEIVSETITTGRTSYPDAVFRLDRSALRWTQSNKRIAS